MRMIPAHPGTQLHVVGARAAKATVPENRERVPALVSTTLSLGNRPGKQPRKQMITGVGGVPKPEAAVAKTEPAPPPVAQAKDEAPAARKKGAVGAQKPSVRKNTVQPGKKATGGKPASHEKPQAGGRQGTKKESVLALLRRSQGATIAEIMKATGWQSHSVRGFLSGAVKKRLGLKLKSGKRDSGERVYSIRG